jgi:cereblon
MRSVDTSFIQMLLQIRQLGRLDDGSVNVKARGQQRFRLIRHWQDVDGVVSLMSN